MTLWQTQQMEEDARLHLWEELNEEQPDLNEGRREDARSTLSVALKHLAKVREYIEAAADEVIGLPDENEIASFLSDVDEMSAGLRNMQNDLRDKRKWR